MGKKVTSVKLYPAYPKAAYWDFSYSSMQLVFIDGEESDECEVVFDVTQGSMQGLSN